jgi:hypothetical protein
VQQGILPIEFLIAAPLEALVRAQAMAARTTAEFVGEVGFETDKEGISRARMLDFEYVHPRADPNNPGNVVDTPVRVRVPVLAMLSIPNVAVEEASVDLHLRVVGQQPVEATRATASTTIASKESITASKLPLPMPENRMRMIGTLAAPKYAEQSASLRVSIKIKQAAAPEGLSQILHLLGEATTARPIGER